MDGNGIKKIKNLEDLTPDPRNANKGTERGIAVLEKSLEQYGAGRSILVDKNGTVIAGNKTLEQAVVKDFPVRVVETDGKELVAVQRTDLELDKDNIARELGYADNRSSQLGLEWDPVIMLEDINNGVDLNGLFAPRELEDLTGETFTDEGKIGQGQEQEIPPEFSILIECDNEQEQRSSLEKLLEMDIKCRALVS